MTNKTLIDTAHTMANDLYEAGVINAITMREYDELCIKPVSDLTPREIKAIRLKAKVSQTVFAKYLNASPSTVKQWERGEKHPRGIALKLLNIVNQQGLGILNT